MSMPLLTIKYFIKIISLLITDIMTQYHWEIHPTLTHQSHQHTLEAFCASFLLRSLTMNHFIFHLRILIYGEQHSSKGIISDHYMTSLYSTVITLGILTPISLFLESDLCKNATTQFLFDSRYSKQLTSNFSSILCGIGVHSCQ